MDLGVMEREITEHQIKVGIGKKKIKISKNVSGYNGMGCCVHSV